MLQRVVAGAIQIRRNPFDQIEHNRLYAFRVLSKDGVDLGGGYRFNRAAGEEPAVIIRDKRDVHDCDGLLQSEIGFRVLCHADYFPSLTGKPPALRLRGESRPVDYYDRACL